MRIFNAVVGLAVASPSLALCPMGKRALEDPESFKHHFDMNHNSKDKRQSGPAGLPFTQFSKNQLIDVTGQHQWVAPGPQDIRGPCPGLNALANHGYLPHSGVTPLTVAAAATSQVNGLAPNIGLFLSVYATLIDGDPVGETWSIGRKPPAQALTSILLGPGDGLSGSHNKYEGDASPSRGDYYLYNGDVASLRVERFKALYDLAKNDQVPNYNLDVITKHRKFTFDQSKSTNPYFFYGPFTGIAVSSAAHTFIPALMSNHSDEYPNGILDKETLKSFFAITESNDGTLSWKPGYERIPNNWYRRPLGLLNEYNVDSLALDILKMAQTVPEVLSVGGNTGTVNSFTGVDLGDITTGVYRTKDLADPKKLVCFFYQLTLSVVPDFLRSQLLGSILASALNLLHSTIDPLVDPSCAKIGNYNDAFLAQFPGAAVNKPPS